MNKLVNSKFLALLFILPLPIGAHSGHDHEPLGDSEKFVIADADSSGGLTLAEFGTNFSTLTPKGNIRREFKKANTDRNGDVSLEEWLSYRAATPEGRARAAFEAVDADEDGYLDLDEFSTLMPGNKAFIHTRAAFLNADEDEDSSISLEEWIDYSTQKGRHKHGEHLGKFDLADLDANESISPEEFALTYPPRAKPAAILKIFAKLDRNDDSSLSRDELNPRSQGSL